MEELTRLAAAALRIAAGAMLDGLFFGWMRDERDQPKPLRISVRGLLLVTTMAAVLLGIVRMAIR